MAGPIDTAIWEDSIHISSIALEIRQQFGKPIQHTVFQAEHFKKEIPYELPPGHKHYETFNPPLKLSIEDRLSVSMRYRANKIPQTFRISLKPNEIVEQAQDDGQGKKTYVTFQNNIVVTVVFTRGSYHGPVEIMSPTTSEILRICPRFRLLIIGNSGVGKSTLIRNVFGVQDVDVSDSSRGKADIDREFVAMENDFFVVHDSLGLEAAEGNNFAKVKKFIDGRRKQKELKDRLHAIWVCIQVPYAKGRVLEAGMEEFLRDRKKIVGDIPIVVALTKLDLLDNLLMMELRREGVKFKSIEEVQPYLAPRRSKFIEEHCTGPIQRAVGGNVPHVAVSTKTGYHLEPTISQLVRTTTDQIEWYIRTDPSNAGMTAEEPTIEQNAQLYIAEMAQRASIEKKVDLAVAIGKRKYWSNLGMTLRFSADKMKDYLSALHQDIVRTWNFHDPAGALQSDDLKVALLDTSDLAVNKNTDGQDVRSFATVMQLLLNDPTTLMITLPIQGAVALGKLCLRIHESAEAGVKRYMAYIVDLIYVMKILFILAPRGSITANNVAVALEAYKRSMYRHRVHLELKDFDTGLLLLPGKRGRVVDRIETLVRRFDVTDADVSRSWNQSRSAAPRR